MISCIQSLTFAVVTEASGSNEQTNLDNIRLQCYIDDKDNTCFTT